MRYANFIKFDHEFIGRQALQAMQDRPHRRKVTFEWNAEDVVKVFASMFGHSDAHYKWIEFPWINYAATMVDKVMKGDRMVGLSLFSGYSDNERCILSLGMVDPDIALGDVLTLVWGEPDQGAGLASVERHQQTTIRVRVSATPYARQARENYADGWRTSTR